MRRQSNLQIPIWVHERYGPHGVAALTAAYDAVKVSGLPRASRLSVEDIATSIFPNLPQEPRIVVPASRDK